MKKSILRSVTAAVTAAMLLFSASSVIAEEASESTTEISEEAADAETSSGLTLAGRTAVFAGATGLIGRGAVRKMAEKGMNVIMVTHDPSSAQDIVDDCAGLPGKVEAVSNENTNAEIMEQVAEDYGSVDVIISSTGDMAEPQAVDDIDLDTLNDRLNHKITSVLDMIQAALPYLRESSHGRIILTASAGALDGSETENTMDEIAGGGVISMTYALARELADENITVNCIARSGMINDHNPVDEGVLDISSYEDTIPTGHAGTAEEYGGLVEYIASEEADNTTGNVFNLSGGLTIGG